MTGVRRCAVVVAAVLVGLAAAATPAHAVNHTPFGSFDDATRIVGGVEVTGWAIDPDTQVIPCQTRPCKSGSQPIDVHVYADGALAAIDHADQQRDDVGEGRYGPWHGFDISFPLSAGTHTICVFAINVGPPEPNPLLGPGCRTVVLHATPFGSVETVAPAPEGIEVAGWALDHDTVDPIDIHIYVDGQIATIDSADFDRPDVGAVYPDDGPEHGFDVLIPIGGGTHNVCVFAINVGPPEANPLLSPGCRLLNLDPFGSFETASPIANGIHVGGWAIDPDTAAPIHVHVYVDSNGTDIGSAALPRDDVAGAFPSYGANHGFDSIVLAASGSHRVCAYAINDTPPGPNPLLGVFTSDSCYTVTVP